MNNTEFKTKLINLFKKNIQTLENVQYAWLILDTTKPEFRIEYPGYDKTAQRAGEYLGANLPGFRSCVKVVVFINESNREGAKRKGKDKWVGNGFRDENDKVYFEGDDAESSYPGDIILFIANSVLSQYFVKKTKNGQLKELKEYTKYTIKRLDEWGVYPIFHEIIPEINGCIPEQVYPHSDKNLKNILNKVEQHTQTVMWQESK